MSVFKTLIKDTAKKRASRSVQKNLRKKELQKKVGSGKPAQRKNDTKKVVGEAQRKARTADRTNKTQAVAKKVLPEVNQVRKKVEGMTIDQLSTKFTGKELKAMEMKLKQASKPNQTLLNKISKARDQRTGMVESMESPSAYPSKTPAKFRKKGGMVKRSGGGPLKEKKVSKSMMEDYTSVPKKLSAQAQSKKKKKMGGGKVYKRKYSGKVIKNNMSGQDLVNACYD